MTESVRDEVAVLEAELGWRHRGQIQGFRLTIRNGVLIINGVAISFHALQLVLRNILAARVATVVHNQITVRTGHTN